MNDSNLLYLAVQAAIQAGQAIHHIYSNPNQDIELIQKEDHTPLTLADRKAHQLIQGVLEKTGIPVLSEEGEHLPYAIRKTWNEVWIVDPLDGTKEFIKRNGEFTVNIALVRQHKPVLGVIYVPVSGDLYFASSEWGGYKVTRMRGLGSITSLEELLACAQKLPLVQRTKEEYVVLASRSHLVDATQKYIEELKRNHSNLCVVAMGSSLKMCRMAEGLADCYPRLYPTMEWDTAAGHALLRAVGLDVWTVHAPVEPLQYNKEDLHNPWFVVKSHRQ